MTLDITAIPVALFAGVVGVMSPCVWPLVPVVMASASTGGRGGPFFLAGGLSLSFAVAGTFLTFLLVNTGLDPELFRYVAAGVLVAMGLLLVVDRLGERAAAVLSRLTAGFDPGGGFERRERSRAVRGGGTARCRLAPMRRPDGRCRDRARGPGRGPPQLFFGHALLRSGHGRGLAWRGLVLRTDPESGERRGHVGKSARKEDPRMVGAGPRGAGVHPVRQGPRGLGLGPPSGLGLYALAEGRVIRDALARGLSLSA